MNERGEGGGEGIFALGCLIIIGLILWLVKVVIVWLVNQIVTWVIPLLIPIALAYLLVLYRKEIWKAHLTLGAWVVQLLRDSSVRNLWSGSGSRLTVRLVVFFWIFVGPSLLVYAFVGGGSWLWVQIIEWSSSLMLLRFIFGPMLLVHDNSSFWGLLLALTSAGPIFYGYYRYYFKGPLEDPRLVRFAQAPWVILATIEIALAALVARTKLRLLEQPVWRKKS